MQKHPRCLESTQTGLVNTLCNLDPSSLHLFYAFTSQRADAKLANVESSLQELNALSNAVAEYFCEDPTTFKLEECCSIFHSFCKRFYTAVQVKIERVYSNTHVRYMEETHHREKNIPRDIKEYSYLT